MDRPQSNPPRSGPTPPPPPPSRLSRALARVDWRRLTQRVLYLVLLLSALAGTVDAALESRRARSPIAPLEIGVGVVSLGLLTGFLDRWKLATVSLAVTFLLGLEIAVAAILYGNSTPPALVIAGRTTGFWANGLCLVDLALLAALVIRALPRGVPRVLASIVATYAGLGFAVGMAQGVSLESSILGAGFLASIGRFEAQPAFLTINVILPLALLGLAVRALRCARYGDEDGLRSTLFLLVFTMLPLATGLTLMNRFGIENLTWIAGRTRDRGQVELNYDSAWQHGPDGTLAHRIVVRTPGYTGVPAPTWTMKATLRKPPARGEETTVYLSVKRPPSLFDVVNVTRGDLEVIEDDRSLTDFRLDRLLTVAKGSNALAMVLDTSGSMGPSMPMLRKAAGEFLQRLDPSFQVCLISFEASVTVRMDFPGDRGAIGQQLEKLEAGGNTAMRDALMVAQERLEKVQATRKLIVVFTDGGDNSSTHSVEEVVEHSQNAGVPIHAIGLGEDVIKEGGEAALRKLADLTGGSYTHAQDSAGLGSAFGSVFDLIACSYVLTYKKPPMPAPTVSLSSPLDRAVTPGSFKVAAQATGGALDRIALFIDDAQVKECAAASCEYQSAAGDLAEGEHVVRAVAYGKDGEKGEDRRTVIIRSPPPEVSIDVPGQGAVLYKPEDLLASVRCKGEPGVSMRIDGKLAGVERVDSGQYRSSLRPAQIGLGSHRATVTVTDALGQSAEESLDFKVVEPVLDVRVLGLVPGGAVHGKVRLEVQVRSTPREIATSSVVLATDTGPLASPASEPYVSVLDSDPMEEGKHRLTVTASTVLGLSKTVEVPFEVRRPRWGIAFPGLTDGQSVARPIRLVPAIIDDAKIGVDHVEYTIGSDAVAGKGADFGLDFDPGAHPEGVLEVTGKAVRKDGATAQVSIELVVTRPPALDLYVSATRNDQFLTPAEFDAIPLRVTIGTHTIQASDVKRSPATEVPLIFALAIDCSGSMNDEEKLPRARDAAAHFFALKRAHDQAGLVAFSDTVRTVSDLTRDEWVLSKGLENLHAEGETALYDAIHTSISMVMEDRGRRAVFVLTDGVDQNAAGTGPGSVHGLNEVADEAAQRGIAIDAIGLGRELKVAGARGERVLKYLARKTGGSYYYAPGPSALRDLFTRFANQVQSATHVKVFPKGLVAGKEYPVALTTPDKDLTLIYPEKPLAR